MSNVGDQDLPPVLMPDHGRRGSLVRVALTAARIAAATEVRIQGVSVTLEPDPGGSAHRLHMLLSIAANAAPGWRDVDLIADGQTHRLEHAFEILADGPSGGHFGWPGIGSHLI